VASPRRDPQGIALDDFTRRRSWAELADRTARIAHLLRDELGLAPGDHAAVLMANRVECVELMLGALHAGVWLTPINWHLTPDEIAYVVADSGARVLFTDAEHELISHQIAHATARGSAAKTVLVAGDDLEAAIAGASDVPMDLTGPAGGPMIYTSGTTGRPKGVRRYRPPTLARTLETQAAGGARIGLTGEGPHLVTGPCYHAAPLMFAIYDQMNGAPIVILPAWNDRHALAVLQEREIGQTHLVPTMFVRLLRLPDEERARFRAPALRLVLHGAAPVSRHVKQRMLAWWGEVLVEYWGATESGVITLASSREWLEHPETVGRVLPSFEVFTVDDAGGRLPAGEEGLLYARHREIPDLFEYHGDPQKTAASRLAGAEPGVFTIGDIGRVDTDGFVYLADRQSHTIISGGVNIYPAEIEHVLQEHPSVADVAVFGVPDDEWGESVKAAVELVPGALPSEALASELLAFARERLAGYKVPRSLDFETALPRHSSGKLYVRQLREKYWAGRERRI
jgi:long-chain acyl-CoA synthetase